MRSSLFTPAALLQFALAALLPVALTAQKASDTSVVNIGGARATIVTDHDSVTVSSGAAAVQGRTAEAPRQHASTRE